MIDEPLGGWHSEIHHRIVSYHNAIHSGPASRQGAALASLLMGRECGVAPEARLYYVAVPANTIDADFYTEALNWIIQLNASLPSTNRIRVVSVSAQPLGAGSLFGGDVALWDATCQRAEQAGILVLDATSSRCFVQPCRYNPDDPENPAQCQRLSPLKPCDGQPARWLLVPACPRTAAEELPDRRSDYQYRGQGDVNWAIPYCAGVLALGWQVRSDLDAIQMKALLFESAFQLPDGSRVINPPEFIRRVRAASGGRMPDATAAATGR
jgi:serine protease AprX